VIGRDLPVRGPVLAVALLLVAPLVAVVAIPVIKGMYASSSGRAPAATPGSLPASTDAHSFQKGMVFGLFARDEPGHTDKGLAEMKQLGVDSVSIIIPWVIADVRATTMAPRGDMTPSDASLIYTIRRAHEEGLRVFLMPILYVDHMEGDEWRGTLAPSDWSAWFGGYEAFILHYAELAEAEGVEYLSVGSELCSTETRTGDWLRLMGGVRAAYKGRLTYSANWDHRVELGFAGALDFLGMNAYFKLSDQQSPAEQELVDAWKEIVPEIEAWRARTGKPLILTEVGYPSRQGAATDPWNYSATGAPDPQAQLRCYRAFRTIWSGEAQVEGVYFYLWWGDGGPEDTGYTPRGKPAAEVVREWFTQSQRAEKQP